MASNSPCFTAFPRLIGNRHEKEEICPLPISELHPTNQGSRTLQVTFHVRFTPQTNGLCKRMDGALWISCLQESASKIRKRPCSPGLEFDEALVKSNIGFHIPQLSVAASQQVNGLIEADRISQIKALLKRDSGLPPSMAPEEKTAQIPQRFRAVRISDQFFPVVQPSQIVSAHQVINQAQVEMNMALVRAKPKHSVCMLYSQIVTPSPPINSRQIEMSCDGIWIKTQHPLENRRGSTKLTLIQTGYCLVLQSVRIRRYLSHTESIKRAQPSGCGTVRSHAACSSKMQNQSS